MELSANHPLRAAKWIWPESYMYLYNHYAHFRKDFTLPVVPRKAPFFVTADRLYKLYVNGVFVCRGPARGYQSHWPFDEVDLAPILRKGRNWISIEAYNPGISTFQYIHQNQAGMICAGQWGKTQILSDRTWEYRRSPGHAIRTARYSMQMDFQEHCDASLCNRKWITDARPVKGWSKRAWPGQSQIEARFGRPPWDTVEPRGIPLMREEIVTPNTITATAVGPCADGYATQQNVSWGWIEELKRISRWGNVDSIGSSRRGDWLEFRIEPTGKGRFRSVTLDFGRMLVSNLVIEVLRAAGGEILDFQHDQCLRDGRPQFLEPGNACELAMANRIRLSPGTNSHEFFHILAARHVTLIARDVARPLVVRIKARNAGYPFTMRGVFDSSDATLNAIHAACRTTQQICSLDAYVDTPWREQAQWWGDARVQALNTFYLDGDTRLLVRGIRSIAGQATSQGLTYGHAPTVAYNCILPDFSLTWILTLWDHYFHTADISLFREMYPRLEQVLGYFRTPEARTREGLIRYDPRFWYFGDWADLYRGDVPTFLNLWYLLALRATRDMLRAAGMIAESRKLAREDRTLTGLVERYLFDRKLGLMCDGLDDKRVPSQRHSVHEQTLALMTGIAPHAHEHMISSLILPFLRGENVAGSGPSAFWSSYVLSEIGRRGYGAEAIDFIRRRWTPMLSTGTTWEGFDWDETSGGSCSHAWSAHPAFHLVNVLAGIRPTAPGWSAIDISPCFAKGIDRARARVPSPRGDIDVAWVRQTQTVVCLSIGLPKGVTARVHIPGMVTATLKGPVRGSTVRVAWNGG